MIAALLFDLYETLVSESGLHPARASSLAAALGLDAFRAEWRKCGGRASSGESNGHQLDTTGGEVISFAPAKVLKTQCAPVAQLD